MDIRQPAEIHIPPKPQEALEDRKLLDRPSREETLQSDSWRVLRITSEFVAGFDHLADVYPAVSIFGSARTKLSNKPGRIPPPIRIRPSGSTATA